MDGAIPWSPANTAFPRFYADGAAKPKPEVGELITKIAGAEMYFVIDAIERLLSPRGYVPISALHGGEPLGRRVMNYLGNSPRELGERSGITMDCLRREWESLFKSDRSSDDGQKNDLPARESGANADRQIVSDARDMQETSVPQAFAERSVSDLGQFLKLYVFGDLKY